MEWFLYFVRSIDSNGRLRIPGIHDLGEVTAFVGDVGDSLQATVGEQHEVTAVSVLAMAGFRVPMQASMQGISCHVLKSVVRDCLWRDGTGLYDVGKRHVVREKSMKIKIS